MLSVKISEAITTMHCESETNVLMLLLPRKDQVGHTPGYKPRR